MIYIYDILLNFTDSNRILEFYEWDNSDFIDHIKRIPLYRISTEKIDCIIHNKIKVDSKFLENIKNRTLLYKNKKSIDYACLFSDGNKVVAVEFNKDGSDICKSFLMLDEEEEVIDETIELDCYDLSLEILSENKIDYFLTRKELFKQNYLILEIKNLYKSKSIDKFNYLYNEVFGDDTLSIQDKYHKFIGDISHNYNYKYNSLYDIVRLSYSKNKK